MRAKSWSKKTGLVRTAATEVPEGFIRLNRFQAFSNSGKCIFPTDGAIMAFARFMDHRFDESATVFQFSRREGFQLTNTVFLPEIRTNAGLQVRCHGLERFLQTSGNDPASLTMPPFWPPMPNAQVLQAFLDLIACHIFQKPPISRALRRV